MPAKSRFTRLDAFTKTVEDARIRTTTGGVVTITSLLIVFYLIWGEWSDYRRVVVHPELIVDKGRGKIIQKFGCKSRMLMVPSRGKNGDPFECLVSSDTLRIVDAGCDGRFGGATDGRAAWNRQSAVGTG